MASKENPGLPLTARQKTFVQEYLIDLNAYQAYLRAGYSANPKTARGAASRLMSLPNVKKAIEKAKAKRAKKAEIDQQRVLVEEGYIAFADPGDYCDENGLIPVHKLSEKARRALASIKEFSHTLKDGSIKTSIEYRFWDKGGSLKRIGDHLGMFPNIHRLTGADGGALQWQEVPMDIESLKDAIQKAKERQRAASADKE